MSSVLEIVPSAGRLPAAVSDPSAARVAWRPRALLVGGGFQVVFGALWLARGMAAFAPPLVAVAAGGTALAAGLARTS